jgi:CTP-dependent riboflavin kinase
MAAPMILVGRVARGAGEGASFTQIPWARAAFIAQLGIDPYPGTLNLTPEDARAWAALRATPSILIRSPDPKFCNALAWRIRVAGRVDAAIVVPEVPGYPDDKIEIIAAVSLRDALGLADGDRVELAVLSLS